MITKEQALEVLEDMDDFARMSNIEPIGHYNLLQRYIEQQEYRIKRFEKALRLLPMLNISEQPEWNMSESNPEVWYLFLDRYCNDLLKNENN